MLRGGGMPYFHSRQGNKTLMNHIIAITCSGCWNIYIYIYWGSVDIYALAVAKDKTEIISTQTYELTWRERMVRTNRIAPTTRYFSLLRVSNKILSITLFRRKLHLQRAKRKQLNFQMINNIKSILIFAKQQGNTLFGMGGVEHRSIVVHICSIESLALSHCDFGLLCQGLRICCSH
jgi:hypothetical protein